jgi:hypothetical protein
VGPVRELLVDVEKGMSVDQLSQKYPPALWNAADLRRLIRAGMDNRDQAYAYPLLVYLYQLVREKDMWLALEVLGQAIQLPVMAVRDRKVLFQTMRKRLDRIKDSMASQAADDRLVQRYWRAEAEYYAAYGELLVGENQSEEGTRFFQIAQGILEQLGEETPARQSQEHSRTLPPQDGLPQTGTEPGGVLSELSGANPPAPMPEPAGQSDADEQPILHNLAGVEVNPAEDVLPVTLPARETDMELLGDIDQQREILAGIQLDIQMSQERRFLLARELQSLEKKLAGLTSRVTRAEKKADTPPKA